MDTVARKTIVKKNIFAFLVFLVYFERKELASGVDFSPQGFGIQHDKQEVAEVVCLVKMVKSCRCVLLDKSVITEGLRQVPSILAYLSLRLKISN